MDQLLDEVDEEESAAEKELGHRQPAEHVTRMQKPIANLGANVKNSMNYSELQ